AFDRQRRLSIQIGIVEVEPDALTTQRRVRKASDGRYDSGTGPRAVSRQVKIVRPFVDACRSLQAGQIRLPCRIGGVEVTPETESDVEVGVFEENARERQARERRHPVGESKLQIEERLRVPHRRAARDRGAPRVPRGATSVWGVWDRGAPRVPRGATSVWGVWDRGAPRAPRGATSVWGVWEAGAPRAPPGPTSVWAGRGAAPGHPPSRSPPMSRVRRPRGAA